MTLHRSAKAALENLQWPWGATCLYEPFQEKMSKIIKEVGILKKRPEGEQRQFLPIGVYDDYMCRKGLSLFNFLFWRVVVDSKKERSMGLKSIMKRKWMQLQKTWKSLQFWPNISSMESGSFAHPLFLVDINIKWWRETIRSAAQSWKIASIHRFWIEKAFVNS